MVEKSLIWDSGGGGDASPHTEADTAKLFAAVLGAVGANKGVVPGMLNELACTVNGGNIQTATGWAIVDGHPYYNDATKLTAIATPGVGTTGIRIVLRCSWASQTVRITEIRSAAGTATIPAMTQTPGTTYDIPLCSATITTGGVITITADDREWAGPGRDIQTKLKTAGVQHNGTTPTDIAATVGNLDIDMKANETWEIEAVASYTCSTTGGLKLGWTVPAGATPYVTGFTFPMYWAGGADGGAAEGGDVAGMTATLDKASAAVFTNANGLIPQNGVVRARVLVVNGSTPGKATLQAAQNNAAGTTTINSATIRGLRQR